MGICSRSKSSIRPMSTTAERGLPAARLPRSRVVVRDRRHRVGCPPAVCARALPRLSLTQGRSAPGANT
jgi:hypothetical protein